uniref:Na(+)/H(+) exchange regulatory cofactor NHE-RF n=1 Tax=Kryptolebias marmoratus TaxID=37003 RepID=A0A3Q3B769_KRYMA
MEVVLRPRLCFLVRTERGYGFHLHGEKNKGGQFIRKVDPGSSADLAGLRPGDRLVEVNGENVEKETHHQVVNRICEVSHRTRLLVVDRETDEYLRSRGLACTEELAVEMGTLSPRPSPIKMLAKKPADELLPRLCHLLKEEHGYGFNLQSDKKRGGQIVRAVDPDSPAERAGVRSGDRIVEVNGVNTRGLRHSEVVALIKSEGEEVRLLVVDQETDELFHGLGITPTSSHIKGQRARLLRLTDLFTPNGSTAKSSSRLFVSQIPDDDDRRISDPFVESGLRLSPTAAEAKQKIVSNRKKKRAPPMDWCRKQEVFSNF